MTMRFLMFLFAICFSAAAFAQSPPPKVGNKPLAQVKPQAPIGGKLVGPKAPRHRYLRKRRAQFLPVRSNSLSYDFDRPGGLIACTVTVIRNSAW
jgi:hypothetical protein